MSDYESDSAPEDLSNAIAKTESLAAMTKQISSKKKLISKDKDRRRDIQKRIEDRNISQKKRRRDSIVKEEPELEVDEIRNNQEDESIPLLDNQILGELSEIPSTVESIANDTRTNRKIKFVIRDDPMEENNQESTIKSFIYGNCSQEALKFKEMAFSRVKRKSIKKIK